MDQSLCWNVGLIEKGRLLRKQSGWRARSLLAAAVADEQPVSCLPSFSRPGWTKWW
mgnify:CR=1 FL=1